MGLMGMGGFGWILRIFWGRPSEMDKASGFFGHLSVYFWVLVPSLKKNHYISASHAT